MIDVVPNYYNKFECIKDKCKHNCCIGWEIQIDEDTMALYQALNTPMGEKIRSNIEGEVPHFVLKDGNRCPFLNKNGLCDIIMEYGEDAICDICYLHPRFKNFYSSFTETGIGLSCEEAARIVLFEEEKFSLPMPSKVMLTKNEQDFFDERKEILSLLLNRRESVFERFSKLAQRYGFKFEFSLDDLREKLLSLEILDTKWMEEIERINNCGFSGEIFKNNNFSLPFEQLSVYFIFRHLSGAIDDRKYKERVRFALLGCYLIGAVFESYGEITWEKMIDIVRMYSAEIEYCEENTDALINF